MQLHLIGYVENKRVAHLMITSLPRLEPMAVMLSTRLATIILSSIECQCDINLWSDIQIVLHWINSSKKLKLFVSTQLSEIVSAFPASHWHYCPIADNLADLFTRGITCQQFAFSTNWKHGQPWLISKTQ